MTEGRETPDATIATWAGAWRRLDAPALTSLFAPDAAYEAALAGTVRDLRRSFALAARVWSRCDVEGLHTSTTRAGAEEAEVAATYRFTGATRKGKEVDYQASATFELARTDPGAGWVITSFRESLSDR